MRSWESIRDESIFPGESKGQYGALLGYTNQPGRQFDHIDLTGMTVDQAIEFANSKGPYAAYSRAAVGRMATPMGAYQIVGSTLKDMRDKGRINGNAILDPITQDYLGQVVMEKQGSRAWEGWKGAHIGPGQFQAPNSLEEYRASLGLGLPPQEFINQTQQKDMQGLPVDTSFAGLFGMDSLPGIDGLHSSQMARDGVPQGNPNNVSPAMEMFAEFNEARDGNQATGIGAAFQDALGPSLSDFTVSDPFSAGAAASSVADKMSRDAMIGGYQEYANSRSGPSVPASRFDQAFDVLGAPSVAATTASGLPALDAPVDIAARPEVMGPSFDLGGVTATPSSKPGKEKSRDPNELSTLGKAAFGVGLMTNAPMAIGGLALSNLANGRPVNAGMGFGLGSKLGGLGGLGGLFGGFDGSPSVGTSALDYATGRALGNPNYTGMDFSRDFTNMGGMISTGRAAPGMVTAAEFNAAQRDAGLAMGIMEGFSRDFGSAFGGLGGLGGNGSSGGNAGGKSSGKGGSGGKGGGKDESGKSGADGR